MKAAIYNASAGSGKTYRLAYKYVRDVVEEPMLYRHILAVTFTNKATEEMKRRILRQIHLLAANLPSDYLAQLCTELELSPSQVRQRALEARTLILHDYSRFTVLTIDKFFQRVLRAFIQELGIDIDYSLEIDSSPIVTQGADALIEEITTNKSLRKWLMELVQERIEEGRKWSVREGILALKEELFKEQARETLDSSRTKEELQQIINEGEQQAKKIIEEIKTIAQRAMERIAAAGLTCDDFKGKGRSLAHIFRRIIESREELPEITASQRNNAPNIDQWCVKGNREQAAIAAELIPLVCEIIERYDLDMKQVNTSRLMRENYRSFALMYDLYHKTQEICQEQNTMLLSQTSRILEEFIHQSDAPFIYEKVGNRYSHFMIDEFQDTSRREWNNFLPLLLDTIARCEPKESRILIVGDIKQSIYRWRGGDWRILHSDVERELGDANTEMINMVDNYRSLPAIVNFNNEIIQRIVNRESVELNEEIVEAKESQKIDQECYEELHNMIPRAYRDHAQNPKREGGEMGGVEVSTYQENPPIMERICQAIDRGYKPCEIMVLTRTNREASNVAQILLEFKQSNDNPKYRFDVMTQEALIVSYAPVSNFIIATLHLSINIDDALQRAIYNHFLGREYIDTPLSDHEREYLRSIRMLSPIEAMESIIEEYRLADQRSNIAYIQAIQEQVINYSKSKIGDISLFLEWWHEKGATQSLRVERSEEAIEILTIHKAKGLEKRVVILPYCNWDHNPKASGLNKNFIWSHDDKVGRFPIQYKKAMGESAFAMDYFRERVYTRIDNINTLYVALTRAVESLHIFVKVTSKGGSHGIGQAILDSLPEGGREIPYKGVDKELSEGLSEGLKSYIWGDMTHTASRAKGEETGSQLYIMDQYESSPTELKLRLPAQRYIEDLNREPNGAIEKGFAPREVGILLHRIFEQSTSRSEIITRIEKMLSDGQIDQREYRELQQMIEQSLSDERAKEWFDGEWDRVRNESEIIRPKGLESRRPDRVMIRGDRAVVVDYKFGSLQPASHQRQMRLYMDLLMQMGYLNVEGYIWYLRDNEIVEILQ